MIWGCEKNRMKKMEIENRIREMSRNERQNISGTCQLLGQVWFASAFVEPIISGHFSLVIVIIGVVLSLFFFRLSFSLAKKLDYKL
jgi:hypothetical protein